MEEQKTPARLKIICRVQDGQYSEELRCNDLTRTAPFTDAESHAFMLLHSFSPEQHTREFCQRVPGAVLVFRTDTVQMEQFAALLHDPQSK